MGEPLPPAPSDTPVIPYAAPVKTRPSLLRLGGALGAAAIAFEIVLFLAGCFGLSVAFKGFPAVAVALSIGGLLFSLIGALWRTPLDEDSHVLFGLFANALGLAGALLEMGVGKGWPLFK